MRLNPILTLLLFTLGSLPLAADAPLPYLAKPAFPGLSFPQPVAIVAAPGETHRLFIVEKEGRIALIRDLAHPSRTVFLDLTDRVGQASGEQGLLALAFHPDFKRNRQFYVWYTRTVNLDGRTTREDRLARFLASEDNPDVAVPSSEQLLLSQKDDASNHNGGELAFGPDGYLYLSLGDEGGANDKFKNAQRIDQDFFAGILRFDVDLRPGNPAPNPHAAVHAGTYAVPKDNPFIGATRFNGAPVLPAAVRTEFWAVGLRNPWRMSFDPATGMLWCGDVGQNIHEEINVIVRGGNYGWSYREGIAAFGKKTPPAEAAFIGPVWDYDHTKGLSITGGLVYHGPNLPALEGKYLFADYLTSRIWALTPDGDKPVTADRVQQIASAQTITSFGRDPRNGDVLLASFTRNTILRLTPATK